MLAATPLLFAMQQAAEGVVWLTFSPSDQLEAHRLAVAVFLGVAMVAWPLWISIALRSVERSPSRRVMLTMLACLGAVVSATSTVMLMRWPPVPVIVGHSIQYDSGLVMSGTLGVLLLVGYVLPTIGPFFVSTIQTSQMIGATLVASLVLTILVERDALTSVWCFFAAILSLQIQNALKQERRFEARVPHSARIPSVFV